MSEEYAKKQVANLFAALSDMSSEELKNRDYEILQAEKENAEQNAVSRFNHCGIEKSQTNYSFENFQRYSNETDKLFTTVKIVSDSISSNKTSNLILLGKPGIGKTHLSIGFLREITKKQKKCLEQLESYYSIQYSLSVQLYRQFLNCPKYDNKNNRENFIKTFGNIDVLCIDEIGRQGNSPEEINLLFEIINKRTLNHKSSILISNYKEDEFIDYLGPACIDRIMQNCVCPNTSGIESYRQKKITNQ